MKTWGTRENTMRKPSPKCFENIEENVSRESLVFCLEMFCSNAGREKRTFTNTQRNELGNSATYCFGAWSECFKCGRLHS